VIVEAVSVKSPTEEFCRSEFAAFLRRTSDSVSAEWKDGDEPPDFYLSLNGEQYAVEVTTLLEQLPVGAGQLPVRAITATLWSFVEEIERTARDSGYLHGTYIIHFSKAIDDLRNVRESIKQVLLAYIENTQDLSDAPDQVAYEHGPQRCVIKKVHNQADQIHKAGPVNFKWQGEAAEDICQLLQDRLSEKDRKLRGVFLPKILLLYDAYHFADQAMYRECLSNLPILGVFYAVFVARSNRDSFMLYTQNGSWV
jgi:hypothetical protein